MTYKESRLLSAFNQLKDYEQDLIINITEELLKSRRNKDKVIHVDFSRKSESI